jgi:FkbM family methyltransferase
MHAFKRAKQAIRILLGLRHYPTPATFTPQSYEEQVYHSLLRSGDVVYDVGANDGSVALCLARVVGPKGLVIAFEPVWSTYVRMCKNIQFDTHAKANIVTVPYGISNANDVAMISLPDTNCESASLADQAAWNQCIGECTITQVPCSLRTLDSLASELSLPAPDFIKVDVEGAERLVVEGAAQVIAAQKPLLLLEVFAPWEAAFQYRPFDLLSSLMEQGYRFLFACPTGLVPHEPQEMQPFPVLFRDGYNVIAYQDTRHESRIASLAHLMEGSREVLGMYPPPMPNE